VIDVVEGTAIEALPFMNQIIAERPKHFDSQESAIKWTYASSITQIYFLHFKETGVS
jgi:protein phosphatase methylesterase 1